MHKEQTLLCESTNKKSYNLFWNQLGTNANALRPITVWEKMFTCCFDRLKKTYDRRMYVTLNFHRVSLHFTRDRSNNITTKLYDKRDAFGFHIVNFPFMSSNIPSAPAYGVYASQLVRYARCCSSYSDFLIHHRALVKRLLSQGYKINHLSNTFKKFYGRHTDLVGQYKKNVCQMFADSIS